MDGRDGRTLGARFGKCPASPRTPIAVSMSIVSSMSLMPTGLPSMGGRTGVSSGPCVIAVDGSERYRAASGDHGYRMRVSTLSMDRSKCWSMAARASSGADR